MATDHLPVFASFQAFKLCDKKPGKCFAGQYKKTLRNKFKCATEEYKESRYVFSATTNLTLLTYLRILRPAQQRQLLFYFLFP